MTLPSTPPTQTQAKNLSINAARRPFGRLGGVSLFTLGTMRATKSEEQMYEVLESAAFAGINHLETSPAYGSAESFLGKALKKLNLNSKEPKGGWMVTSKLLPGLSFKEGQKQLQGILERLDIPKINSLAIHGINLTNHLEWTINGEGADLLQWAEEEKLIEQVGFSSHGSLELIEAAIESNRFQFCSLHLHLLDPSRLPLAKLALEKGMGVMAISPADKGGRLYDPSKTLIEDCKPFPPLELAYRFLIAQEISTLTLGASKAADLSIAKKLRSSDKSLSLEEQDVLKSLKEAGERRVGASHCGQCRKCLPCPKSIPITELLRLRNLTLGYDLEAFAKERYNLIGKAGHWWESTNANACEKCKECLPRCPYNLAIPDLLEETHKLLADKPRRRLWS